MTQKKASDRVLGIPDRFTPWAAAAFASWDALVSHLPSKRLSENSAWVDFTTLLSPKLPIVLLRREPASDSYQAPETAAARVFLRSAKDRRLRDVFTGPNLFCATMAPATDLLGSQCRLDLRTKSPRGGTRVVPSPLVLSNALFII